MVLSNPTPKAAARATDARVRPRPIGCPIPLTIVQRLEWNSSWRNGRMCEGSLRLVGELDEPLLRRCVDTVVMRHEALRTRIVLVGETPLQEVIAAPYPSFEVIDLRAKGSLQVQEIAARLAQELHDAEADWGAQPLFATRLLRFSDSEHVLLVGIDHMVGDGYSYSQGIVRKEIATLYHLGARGMPQCLPPPAVQFGDYAVWQQQTFESWRELHWQYWRERLTGVPKIEFPFDGTESEQGGLRWTISKFALGKELSSRLRQVALQNKMLFPLVFLGLATAVVARWCGQSAWTVNVMSHGRHHHPELANTVGWFNYLLPLQFEIEENDSLLHVVERIHLEYATAIEHHDHGRLAGCMPSNPIELGFNWADWTRAPLSAIGAGSDHIDITPFVLTKFRGEMMAPSRAITFVRLPGEDAVAGDVLGLFYQEGLLTARTVERLSDTIRRVAEAFAANPLIKQRALALAP